MGDLCAVEESIQELRALCPIGGLILSEIMIGSASTLSTLRDNHVLQQVLTNGGTEAICSSSKSAPVLVPISLSNT